MVPSLLPSAAGGLAAGTPSFRREAEALAIADLLAGASDDYEGSGFLEGGWQAR